MQDYVQRTDTLDGDELIDRKIQKMKVRMMMMKSWTVRVEWRWKEC